MTLCGAKRACLVTIEAVFKGISIQSPGSLALALHVLECAARATRDCGTNDLCYIARWLHRRLKTPLSTVPCFGSRW